MRSEVERRVAEIMALYPLDYSAPARETFPGGLRWRYFTAKAKGRKRERWFAWSTVRNTNGKFVSWAYHWEGEEAEARDYREHAKRKDAKARALRMKKARSLG